jgi:hypothetical protein
MKKSELKTILKPLVKECVKDVLLEEGLLSNVVSEVARGLSANVIVENNTHAKPKADEEHAKLLEEKQALLKEKRRKMLDATGFGTNIFEGTEPISKAGDPSSPPQAGALAGVDPNDAGVDLNGIMAVAGRNWRDMI